MKKIATLSIALIFCFSCSITAMASGPSSNGNETSIPQTMSAYLYDDAGNCEIVTGYLVKNSVSKSPNLNTLIREDFLNNSQSYSDLDLYSATYAFSLLSTNNTLTATGSDGTLASTVYLTINYSKLYNSYPDYYLLTSVSGHWDIHDSLVRVTSSSLRYYCQGPAPAYSQTATRSVSNYFNINTGFTEYVSSCGYGNMMGSELTVNYKMGTSRTWSFTLFNKLF